MDLYYWFYIIEQIAVSDFVVIQIDLYTFKFKVKLTAAQHILSNHLEHVKDSK